MTSSMTTRARMRSTASKRRATPAATDLGALAAPGWGPLERDVERILGIADLDVLERDDLGREPDVVRGGRELEAVDGLPGAELVAEVAAGFDDLEAFDHVRRRIDVDLIRRARARRVIGVERDRDDLEVAGVALRLAGVGELGARFFEQERPAQRPGVSL